MKNFIFNIPTKIIYGKEKIRDLNEEIPANFKNILLVTDEVIFEKTDIIEKTRSILKHRNILIYKNVEENPSITTINEGGIIARDNQIDMVIGIGGGSSMDAAKGIAIMATNQGCISDYIQGMTFRNNPLPIVCIPTSSGTGSEVTPFAVFIDPGQVAKVAIAHSKIFPFLSIIDPELTYSMPPAVIVNTGLDALSHSIEAYLSTESYDLIDQISLRSIEIVIDNIEKAVKKDTIAMDNMAYASTLGGMAITHASTILLHIMGYPLTVYHNIPHGKANAIILPAFMEYMRENSYVKDKVEKVLQMFEKKHGINNFINNMGVSTKLSDYGINKNEFQAFTQKVIIKSDVKITPADITEDVIYNIYLNSYK